MTPGKSPKLNLKKLMCREEDTSPTVNCQVGSMRNDRLVMTIYGQAGVLGTSEVNREHMCPLLQCAMHLFEIAIYWFARLIVTFLTFRGNSRIMFSDNFRLSPFKFLAIFAYHSFSTV